LNIFNPSSYRHFEQSDWKWIWVENIQPLQKGNSIKEIMKAINYILFLSVLFSCSSIGYAQADLHQSGPMVGYSDYKEVALWVQTNATADVKIIYWIKNNRNQKYETDVIRTEKSKAFTAKLIADKVQPGNQYGYDLYINDILVAFPWALEFQSQKLWQWREDPPDFSFAIGGGCYINEPEVDRPGKPYGQDTKIFGTIVDKQPDFMLWTGDNIYLREVDWNTWTGILHRYTHTRSTPELQPLLGSVHNYAIWDDHDYGPNNSDRSFWNKEATLEGFKLFFPNPGFGVNGNPGTTTMFTWADIDFFLTDNRYYRSPNYRDSTDRQIFGKEQIEWLIDALCYSRAPFKIIVVGSQFLNPVTYGENHSTYPEETNRLLKMIADEKIRGVIFISGDRHHTELTKFERQGTYPLYDFTISALTSGPHHGGEDEKNHMRVKDTFVGENNFGIMHVRGPRKDRTLTCSTYNRDGDKRWDYSINENDLR